MQRLEKMNVYGPVIVRIGMALVMLWFGSQQLSDASKWFSFLPDWTSALPLSQATFVHLNGWFEIVFGLLLIFGFYTRLAAILLALHLFGIAQSIGYSALGVRDFGLALATLSVFFTGPDIWSLDTFFKKRGTI